MLNMANASRLLYGFLVVILRSRFVAEQVPLDVRDDVGKHVPDRRPKKGQDDDHDDRDQNQD